MKRIFVLVTTVAVVVCLLSSCAATKKDCNGVKHYKQKGGFYL